MEVDPLDNQDVESQGALPERPMTAGDVEMDVVRDMFRRVSNERKHRSSNRSKHSEQYQRDTLSKLKYFSLHMKEELHSDTKKMLYMSKGFKRSRYESPC
jgi:hypothetical protein